MNSEKPLVSIICHCYNHSKFVLETLKSVLNQTYDNIEVIVVDDFSTDNSADVISSFMVKHPEIKFIQNHRNLGITKSFNRILKKTKGKYIIDLAADDLLLPNCVMQQVHCFQNSNYQNLGNELHKLVKQSKNIQKSDSESEGVTLTIGSSESNTEGSSENYSSTKGFSDKSTKHQILSKIPIINTFFIPFRCAFSFSGANVCRIK